MLILSIDTTTSLLSVALLDDLRVLSFIERTDERGQAENLVPVVAQVLEKAGHTVDEVDAVAVTVGPGSFTGIRIGLATARAFGLALDIPVWGVTCFEAYAYQLARDVMVVLDSKRDDYYVQHFDENGQAIDAPHIQTIDELKAELPFEAVGSGAEKLKEEIDCTVLNKVSPLSVSIARVAWRRKENPMAVEPLYLRPADVTV